MRKVLAWAAAAGVLVGMGVATGYLAGSHGADSRLAVALNTMKRAESERDDALAAAVKAKNDLEDLASAAATVAQQASDSADHTKTLEKELANTRSQLSQSKQNLAGACNGLHSIDALALSSKADAANPLNSLSPPQMDPFGDFALNLSRARTAMKSADNDVTFALVDCR